MTPQGKSIMQWGRVALPVRLCWWEFEQTATFCVYVCTKWTLSLEMGESLWVPKVFSLSTLALGKWFSSSTLEEVRERLAWVLYMLSFRYAFLPAPPSCPRDFKENWRKVKMVWGVQKKALEAEGNVSPSYLKTSEVPVSLSVKRAIQWWLGDKRVKSLLIQTWNGNMSEILYNIN